MANPVQLLMLAGLAGTLAWGGYEFTRDNQALPPVPTGEQAPIRTASALPTIKHPSLADYAVVIERPLFFADRKPPPKQPQQTAAGTKARKVQGTGKAPELKVTGIFLEGDDSSVLIEMLASGNNRRLQLGDTVSGWKLVAVDDQAITLQSGRQRQQYKLRQFAEAAQPPARRGPVRRPISRPGQPIRPRPTPVRPPTR